MHDSPNDRPPIPPAGASEPAEQALPPTSRSGTARGGSFGFAQDSIGHAHQWLVRGQNPHQAEPDATAPPAPRGSASVTPSSPMPRMGAGPATAAPLPPRRRESSGSFHVPPGGPRPEESSPFAGVALERNSRPGQPNTNPGVGYPRPVTPNTEYRTPVSVGIVSSALAGLPIQRPRVLSAHGSGTTPNRGPTSTSGADAAAAVLALPDIPVYASPIHPHDVDVQLAFEALFQGALAPRDAAHVAARMWRQTVPAGRAVYSATEPADFADVVATGLARIEVMGPAGMVALLPLRSGDLVGLAALVGDTVHAETVVAASDLVVFCLQRDEFHKLCAEAPLLAQRVLAAGLSHAARRIRAQTERMLAYAHLDGHETVTTNAAPEPQGSRLGRLFSRLAGSKDNR